MFREGSRRSGASSSRSRGTQPGLCVITVFACYYIVILAAAAEHSPACACANRRTRQPRVMRGPAAQQTPGRGQEGQSLGNLTAISQPHLGRISAASRLHLAWTWSRKARWLSTASTLL